MVYNNQSLTHSLYIHWPFCPYKCNFCPFVAISGHTEYMEQYHAMLVKEITHFISSQQLLEPLKTVFMGGGTPSTYPPQLLLDMFGILNNRVGFKPDAEITIEVNPGTVTQEKLDTWRKAGINRLSIGVQSKNDAILKSLNRHQKFEDVISLLENARHIFSNISVDLIVGLPGVSNEEWRDLVNQVISWPITHVSLYFLTVHEDTPLYFGVKQNKIQLPSDDTVVELYAWTREQFERAGLFQYEISNFARPGFESKHNMAYWQRQPYKGVGLGACSFDGQARLQNEKNLLNYLDCIDKNKSVTISHEILTTKQVWLEKLMLGLRQAAGIPLHTITPELTSNEARNLKQVINMLAEGNLVMQEGDMLTLTPAGLAVSNEIIVKLSHI
jgi:oxygen-independent coproporphyrinogen III oxidase